MLSLSRKLESARTSTASHYGLPMDTDPSESVLVELERAVEALEGSRFDQGVLGVPICEEHIDRHGLVCECGHEGTTEDFRCVTAENPTDHVWVSFWFECYACRANGTVRVEPSYAEQESRRLGGPSTRRRNSNQPITPQTDARTN